MQNEDSESMTAAQAMARSTPGLDPVQRLVDEAHAAGQGAPPDHDPDILEELDFSKLPGDLYFTRTISLYVGGRPVPIKLTNRGVAEAVRELEAREPRPAIPVRVQTVRRKDEEGAQMMARGYTGPWPALREVELHPDSPEMRKYHEAMLAYTQRTVYVGLGTAILTPIRDEQGALVKDPEEKCRLLASKGLQPSEAQAMLAAVMSWAPFEQKELAVPTGGGGSE